MRSTGDRGKGGLIWGRGGPVFELPRGDFVTVCECWSGRDSGERTQRGTRRPDEFAGTFGWPMAAGCRRRRQAGSQSPGHDELARPALWLQCEAARRAGDREKNRRRRVLVVTTCSPRPMRAVQRAMLWAISTAEAALAAKRPEGRWFNPTPCLRSILDLGVAAMVGLQFEHLPAGDEAVIAVGGEEGQLGTGRGLDDEPHRRGVRFTWKGVQIGGGVRNRRAGIASLCRLLCWRMVMERHPSCGRRIPRHECRTRCRPVA